MEKGHKYTVGPYDTIRVKSSIKVSSTETGHIFGNIVYDMSSKAKTSVLNLDEIHLDIMDYIQVSLSLSLSRSLALSLSLCLCLPGLCLISLSLSLSLSV